MYNNTNKNLANESLSVLHQLSSLTFENRQECTAIPAITKGQYLSALTAGLNEIQTLPCAAPESAAFLTDLQSKGSSLQENIGMLFMKQHIIPFSYLLFVFPTINKQELFNILKQVAIHVCKGIFSIKTERLYASDRNVAELRNARNKMLEIFAKTPPETGISRELIAQTLKCHPNVLATVVADCGEKIQDNWRLKCSDEGIKDFTFYEDDKILIEKAHLEEKKHVPQETEEKKSDPTSKAKITKIIYEELRNQGVLTYEQILSIVQKEMGADAMNNYEDSVNEAIEGNCIKIGNSILLPKVDDENIEPVIIKN